MRWLFLFPQGGLFWQSAMCAFLAVADLRKKTEFWGMEKN